MMLDVSCNAPTVVHAYAIQARSIICTKGRQSIIASANDMPPNYGNNSD
jgi:hypothetical protein